MVKKVSSPNPNKFAVFRELEPLDYDGLEVFFTLEHEREWTESSENFSIFKYYTASYIEWNRSFKISVLTAYPEIVFI